MATIIGEVVSADSARSTADRAGNSPGYLGDLPVADRLRAQEVLAHAAGIRLPQTIVREGESLIEVGEKNKRALACKVAELPDLADGLLALKAQLDAEKPRDVAVPIQKVLMSKATGGVYGEGQDPAKALAYTDTAFGDIASFLKPSTVRAGFAPTLLALPPAIRADAFNWCAANSTRTKETKGEVTLRTAIHTRSGRRMVRAAVSGAYGVADDIHAFSAVAAAVPAGAKVRYTRGQDISEIEVIWPMMARELRVGDVALASLRIRNSETKRAGIKVSGQVLRVLCYNFTTAYSRGNDSEVDLGDASIRHVGDAKAKIGAAVKAAIGNLEPFILAFGDAYKNALPNGQTRGEIIGRFVRWAALPERIGEAAAKLWDADGAASAGDTLAGLANAVTRASQAEEMEAAIEAEQAAGRVVAQGWAALNF